MLSRSVIRLLRVALLSQAMVIQALLLNWSGATALADRSFQSGSDLGTICFAGSTLRGNAGGSGPEPSKPSTHDNCLSACVMGHGADRPEPASPTLVRLGVFVRAAVQPKASAPEIVQAQAFLARAPPALI